MSASGITPSLPHTAVLSGRLESIQALRAIAALMVVLCHVEFIRRGTVGVDVFFVISGFIMCYISANNSRGFFMHRLFRIVPLYWCATTLMFLLAAAMPQLMRSTPADPSLYLSSLFFIPHARPNGDVLPILVMGWTLNLEMFFYVVFASCLLAGRKIAPWLCALTLLGVTFAEVLLRLPLPLSAWASFYNLEFVAGIAVFQFLSTYYAKLRKIPVIVWPVLGTCALAALLIIEPHVSNPYYVPFKTLPALLVFVSAIMLEGRVRFPALLLVLGDASYSLYLLHPLVEPAVARTLDPMTQLTVRGVLAAALFLSMAAGLAVLSYRFLEKPSNRWLRRVYSRRHAPAPLADRGT